MAGGDLFLSDMGSLVGKGGAILNQLRSAEPFGAENTPGCMMRPGVFLFGLFDHRFAVSVQQDRQAAGMAFMIE